MRNSWIAVTALCALALAGLLTAQSRKNQSRGEPGVFDYYVLSLSWSPQHCAGPSGGRDTQQCADGKQFGFVVHGLWPQYERGYPDNCGEGSRMDPAITRRLLPLMPSDRLIQHEWEKHGVCSGLTQVEYFKKIEKAFGSLKMPADFKAPIKQVYINPNVIRQKFVASNSGLSEKSVKVLCGGRYLSEVFICMTKDLKPRPCSASVRDTCRMDEIIMQPVR
jgi:ribonuclease T2